MIKRIFIFSIFAILLASSGCGGTGGTVGGGSSGGGSGGNGQDNFIAKLENKWLGCDYVCITHAHTNNHHEFQLKFQTGSFDPNGNSIPFGWGNTSARNESNGQVVQPEAFFGKFVHISDNPDHASFQIKFVDDGEHVVSGHGTHDMVLIECSTTTFPANPIFPISSVSLNGFEQYKGSTEKVSCVYEVRNLREIEAPWGP